MKIFYNTTNLRDKNLREAIAKADTQDKIVLAFFKHYPDKTWTPVDVWQSCFDESTPITSVRRSMTNLSDDKDKLGNPIRPELVQTDEQREGAFGRVNNTWKLNVTMPKNFVQGDLFCDEIKAK